MAVAARPADAGRAGAPTDSGRPRAQLLVLRALGLGDLLAGVPALRALAEAFADHRRLLAMPGVLAPLAELIPGPGGAPAFEVVDARGLGPLRAPPAGREVAVNLHGRGPQSHERLLERRPSRLIAFACPRAGWLDGPEWRPGEHEVERWCRLLRASAIPADPARLDIAAPPPTPNRRVRGATVLHPGAASGARRWPWRRWAAVAGAEREAGRHVVLTGTAAERPLADAIARAAGVPGEAVLAGRTDVRQLAGVVAAAGRVASADTGLAHLATALRRPSVVLFGPVPPGEWGPPADRPWHRALWAGRRGDPHGEDPDEGLLAISTAEVIAALDTLPPAGARGAGLSARTAPAER